MIVQDHDQLRIKLEQRISIGQRIGLLNGCFDVLSAKHVELINKAKTLCDTLVVALNDDASIRKLKGEGRPIFPIDHRMFIVDSLAAVDYTVAFHTTDVVDLLNSKLFNIWVKGADYTALSLNPAELNAAELAGVTTALLPVHRNGISTSSIIEGIKNG